jgi:LysM domain
MGAFRQSSLRVLAPASLVVFAIVLLIVVIASLTGGGDSSSSRQERPLLSQTTQRDRARARQRRADARRAKRGVYVVRAGDNLFTIATRTGVPIDTLRALNPTLDPQGLVTGQRVRLPVQGEPGATGASGATGATGSTGATGPG